MPDFKYSALDINGKKQKGIINVSGQDLIKSALLEKNLFLLDAVPNEKKRKNRKLSSLELSDFCRELNAMLSSGITLVRAISIIMNRDLTPNLKNTFAELNSSIKKGCSLSEAMELQENVFPELLINMIKAGEASGNLDETTEKLADLYEKEHRLNVKIKSAMAYPIALLFMTIVIMIIIFTLILPKFFKLFQDIELPASTQFVMNVGNMFTHHTLSVVLVICGIILIIFCIFKNPDTRYKVDKLILGLPKIGKLMKIIYTSRFATTLCSLYSSGISVVNAIAIAGNTIGNSYISAQITETARKVRSGNSLASSVAEIDGFDKKLSSSIAVGEESGKIDTLLTSLSDSYDYEAGVAVNKIVSFIEPVMIFIMGALVAFVVISVMQPIYLLYSNVR